MGGVEEGEEDAAEGGFASGGVVPFLKGVDAAAGASVPRAMAGKPLERGMLASVEPRRGSVRRERWRSTARRVWRRGELSGRVAAGRLPMVSSVGGLWWRVCSGWVA